MKAALFLPLGLAAAFPQLGAVPGVTNKHLLKRQQPGGNLPGGAANCPFNPDHKPGVGSTLRFPYGKARFGLPGTGKGGYQVPAPGDEAHKFMPPTDKDIRGPCPGLNALANHNFIARDGITHYTELVDAIQNVYNVGYDLANFLAAFGIYVADGDPITRKLSIGCDATSRTSWNPVITGSEPGLNGHNKMEQDASLTRNDYWTHGGDNFNFNVTLWERFVESNGGEGALFDLPNVAKWQFKRYQESRSINPQFYFGPIGFFQHGAASFLFTLFPNGNDGYLPTTQNTASFYGARKNNEGQWEKVPERIPDNWVNRKTPYSLLDIAANIIALYTPYPVGFGGNIDGKFVGIDFPPYIVGGSSNVSTPADVSCLLYQVISQPFPSSLNGVITPVVEALSTLLQLIGGREFENLGCPFPLTK
ncbi:Cloroperoxidase [Sporormia fimetaria CBS 119925]|uniref:Cloroperoxidase n=1 Tax=Sporormia fimetaria CBS 119925 TaxID=1340428 RepID=A0A6A6V527_9PLEO|nr:Cloroperoxidase [Sporormia fimetaria CBS 119925]